LSSRARPCERRNSVPGPQRMSDVLAELFARRGYARVEAAVEWWAVWREVAGALLTEHARPGGLKRGVLEIRVANSLVAQEFMFRKSELLAELQARLPDQRIKDLRCRLGPLD
jgi:predicted nucleic acid-binding Zn ribbon protein